MCLIPVGEPYSSNPHAVDFFLDSHCTYAKILCMKNTSRKIIVVIGIVLCLIIIDQTKKPTIDDAERVKAGELCAQGQGVYPPFPYSTDGCSMFPDGVWQSCCLAHDVAYWCGGDKDDRINADRELRRCVNEIVPTVGSFIYGGVRLGEHPLLPFPWRWGYGFPYPHPYKDGEPK